MRNFVICLIACFALVQSTFAATSPLTESLLEYDAITSAIGSNPSFQDVIPPTEFIIDIKRITKQLNNLGTVKYKILTRDLSAVSAQERGESKGFPCRKKHPPITYIATLNVAPNPGIGPNIVTVISIVLGDDQHQ